MSWQWLCKIGLHRWLWLYRPKDPTSLEETIGRRYEVVCLRCRKEKIEFYWLF